MSLSSNNWPDIHTLLSYRDSRAIGHEELMEAGLLVNKKQKGVFSYYYEDTAIDDFISAELYDELAGFSHDKAYSDHLLLIEIVLDTLRYSKKPSAINRRLKLFCFKNMMLHLQHEQELYRTDLFRFFLFFHPCREDLIRSFVLNGKGLAYKGEQIGLHQQVKILFETILNKKSHFASLSGFTEQSLCVSRDIVLSLLHLAEFFMDMYVFYILRQPAELESLVTFFADKPCMQLKIIAILFSHPFYNGEAKLQLVQSGRDMLLPNGFWTERLRKMKDNVA